MTGFLNIWNNDEARAFFKENGYPEQYNDGLLAYLRETYPFAGGQTLPDLLARYLKEYGDTFNMIIAGRSAVPQSLIEPAVTFTNATPTNGGGGTIVLTSAGAHGLTAAAAITNSIYISAGTGWTVGFYPITAVPVDTSGTTFTITGVFDAGMGAPTIALAGTEVTMATVAIPPLLENSVIRMDFTGTSPDTSATAKRYRIKLNTDLYTNIGTTSSPNIRRTIMIHNRNATNSQIGGFTAAASSGEGTTSAVVASSTVNTSVATSINIAFEPVGANIPMTLERYFVEVFK